MSDEREFLSRWSQRKRQARATEDAPSPTVEEKAQPEVPAEFTAEELETLSDDQLCERLDLPHPDTLQKGDDFSVFLEGHVPERLKRVALRRLWRSNPVFGHLDGLNEYDEDFRAAAASGGAIRSLYQAGKGYVFPEEDEGPASAPETYKEDAVAASPVAPPIDAAPQESSAQERDSAPKNEAEERPDEEAPPKESAIEADETGCGRPPQIKSRRMSFRFVKNPKTEN